VPVLLVGFLDASVPGEVLRELPVQRRADAFPWATRASDASADAHPDVAEDALPEPAVVAHAERSVVLARAFPAQVAEALPALELEPYRQVGARSAA